MGSVRRILGRAKSAYLIATIGLILTLAFWAVDANASPGADEVMGAAGPAALPSGTTLAAQALLANFVLPGDDSGLTENAAATPSASPARPGFAQSNACDQKHPTVGHDTADGTPGTPGHRNPACAATPVPAASPAPSPAPAHDNRCDQMHPDQGNDANGHHNPACAAPSTTGPAASPAPASNPAPANHGQHGNNGSNDDQDQPGGQHGNTGGNGNGNQPQPHGQGDSGNHGNNGGGNNQGGGNGHGGGKKKP